MPVEELGVEFVIEGLGTFIGSMKKADDATAEVGTTAGTTSNILDTALAVALGHSIVKAAEMAYSALVRVGGAIVDVSKESVNLATEFQSSITTLQIAASSTGLAFDELHDAAIAVGGDSRLLGVSATGAADAMTSLFKSGLSTTLVFGDLNGYMQEGAELGGALRASIDFAAATTYDMAGAADLASVMLATFGSELDTDAEKAEFVNNALDNLVRSADASVAEVSDLAEAFKNVGPLAATLGMGLDETSNALAVLSTRGIVGADAGTALKSMLANLQRQTPDVIDALDEMNVSLFDSKGEFVGLRSVIYQMNAGLADATDEERALFTQTVAGTYGMSALNTLLAEGTDGWDSMTEATKNAAGMQEQAAAKANTLAGKTEALDGQLETLKIQFGEAIVPAITTFIDTLIPIIDEYGPVLADVFMTISDALSGLANGFTGLLSTNPQGGIAEIVEVIGMLFGENIQQSFIKFTKMLQEDIPLAITFIQGIIGQFQEFFISMSPVIEEGVNQIVNFWNALQENAALIWDGIQSTISGVIDIILGIVQLFTASFAGDWDTAWAGAQQILQGAWDAITGILEAAFGVILSIAGTNMEQLSTTLSQLWEIIKVVAMQTWEAIKTFFSDAWAVISTTAITVGTTVMTFLSQLWQSISTTITTIWQSISDFFNTIWTAISNVFTIALGYILAVITGDNESAEAILNAVWERVKTFLNTTWENIKTLASNAWEAIKTTTSEKFEATKTLAEQKWEALKEAIKTALESLKTVIPQIWEDIKTTMSQKWDDLITAAGEKFSEIKTTFEEKIQAIKDFLLSIDLGYLGSALITGLARGITSGAGAIKTAIDNVINDAINRAKNLLGISSPSTVMRDEIGQQMGMGVALGLRDITPIINSELAAAVKPNISALSPATAGYSYVTNAPNYSRTSTTTQNIQLTPDLLLETVGMTSGAIV